jgi:dienelactone hydrolase
VGRIVTLGADLQAGVPLDDAAAETARVPEIKAPLLIHYAETDERINALWSACEAVRASERTSRNDAHVLAGGPGLARIAMARGTSTGRSPCAGCV